MEVIYTGEEVPNTLIKSLFLAGGSRRPNQIDQDSWRADALKILEDAGFDGTVFCPEPRDMKFDKDFNYDNQIEWEEKCLNIADCILFWIPRDLSLDDKGHIKLGCLTTNIEWGKWEKSGKVVYGAPPKADKNRYIDYYADKLNIGKCTTLTETLGKAIDFIGEGAERIDGERFVPLFIWKTPSFQSWYQSQIKAGNKLQFAELLYNFRPNNKNFVFLWILKVHVYITEEDRVKENEFVIARPDISSVLLYKKANDILDSEVVIIKEFRSPANTVDGFIRELPSGSAKDNSNAIETAAEELFEETGMHIKPNRFNLINVRQLAGTLSSHKAHLYSIVLTQEEIDWFKAQKGLVHGNEEDTERTFIEVRTVSELLESSDLDWTNLGQIFNGLFY